MVGKFDVKLGIQVSPMGIKDRGKFHGSNIDSPLKKNRSWKTYAPSPINRDKNWPIPEQMTNKNIQSLIKKFQRSAVLANKAKVDCLGEIWLTDIYYFMNSFLLHF